MFKKIDKYEFCKRFNKLFKKLNDKEIVKDYFFQELGKLLEIVEKDKSNIIKTKEDFKRKYIEFPNNTNKETFEKVKKKFEKLKYSKLEKFTWNFFQEMASKTKYKFSYFHIFIDYVCYNSSKEDLENDEDMKEYQQISIEDFLREELKQEKPQDQNQEQFKVIGKGEIIIGEIETEIEIERRDVEYFMKKMACESRPDNSWQRIFGKCQYDIQMNFDMRVKSKVQFVINTDTKEFWCILFNKAYFNTEEHAQSCLDKLIEKYGEERLKEIWGVKEND